MADAEKKRRSYALSNFTRSFNALNSLIDDSAPHVIANPQFEKVKSCWEKLELAQESFIEKTDIDIENDVSGLAFLDEPGERHSAALRRYSEYLKKEDVREKSEVQKKTEEDRLLDWERRKRDALELKVAESSKYEEGVRRKFESAKAEFVLTVDAFKRMNLSMKNTLADASDIDKRREWQKLEADFKSLKSKLVQVVGIDHSQDTSAINQMFVGDVEEVFLETQKWILSDLRDSSDTSGGSFDHAHAAGNSTKKEAVRLLLFHSSGIYLLVNMMKSGGQVCCGNT